MFRYEVFSLQNHLFCFFLIGVGLISSSFSVFLFSKVLFLLCLICYEFFAGCRSNAVSLLFLPSFFYLLFLRLSVQLVFVG